MSRYFLQMLRHGIQGVKLLMNCKLDVENAEDTDSESPVLCKTFW